ncbi:MAG: vWA domain-containing protein [Ilumatobacteraceae bacterium]
MEPRIAFDRSVVTINQDGLVHTLVEFTAPDAPAVERPPIDVAFVIDRSGSMEGQPLRSVCDAVADVLRRLGPDDRAAVVTFDNSASLVLDLGRHVGPDAAALVRSITPGGSTNLSAGWLLGHQILRDHHRDGAVRRVVVLTDGHVNQGVVDADELASLVVGGRGSGVSSSFIGFAEGFQEELLGTLANAGGGNDYWCASSDAAAQVFLTEFDGLGRVVAQNVSVVVRPTPAVAAMRVLNDFHTTELADGGLRIDLGDAFGGEERSVLVAFHTRPQPAGGTVEVAEVRLSWVSTVDGFAAHEQVVPVTVTAGEPGTIDSGADPRVTNEVVLLEAARERREYRRLADQGDFDGAERLARSVVDRLSELPGEGDAVQMAAQDLDGLRSRRWSVKQSKRAYTTSRASSRKREASFGDDGSAW